jgi:hypothetical protein
VFFFTCRKILWHGADGFTFLLKEGVLRMFISLKNPSHRLGLNPRTLGPMARTLTITPPRRLYLPLLLVKLLLLACKITWTAFSPEGGVGPVPKRGCLLTLAYYLFPRWYEFRMILTGENRRTRRKTYPSTTLSTTNPTWIDPCANPGLRGERPSTNDLSYDTAQSELLVSGAYFSVSHASRSDVRWKIFHRQFSRTENFPENFPQYFSRKFSVS